jgi:DNA polymerase-1
MLYAWDTETWLIQPGLLAPPLVCVSIANTNGDVSLHGRVEGLALMRSLLADPDAVLVGHNVAYDFAVICAADESLIAPVFAAYRAGRIRDTKIREELRDIAAGRIQKGGTMVWRDGAWVKADYSLAGNAMVKGSKGLVYRYLQKNRSADKGDDAWRKRYDQLSELPIDQWPEDASQYAKEDAQDTLAVYLAQATNEPEAPLVNEVAQTQAAWALHLISTWGIRTDPSVVFPLETALEAEYERIMRRFRKVGLFVPEPLSAEDRRKGREPDLIMQKVYKNGKVVEKPAKWKRDTKKLKAYVERVYKRKGLKAPRTDSGEVATDKDACEQSGSYLLAELSAAGGVSKIIDTYVPALKAGTELPINTRFNTLMNSGRCSSSAPNIQNLPTGRRVGGVREAFVPRPGFQLVSVDYDTLELRALAQVCLFLFGKSAMAEAIKEGRDLHLEVAATLLGITYEQAQTRKKEPVVKEARQTAKCLNFGLPGGLGVETFVTFARRSYGVVITEKRARELKAVWFKAWPEMQTYFNYISSKLGEMGEANLTQFVSGRVRGGVGFCDGCNTLFQGLAADGAKAALFDVAEEMYVDKGTALYGSRIVNFIHDEILAEVPVDLAHEAADRLALVMCAAMARFVPDVPITASPALMTRWYKGAEAVYDDTGRLIPWSPAA